MVGLDVTYYSRIGKLVDEGGTRLFDASRYRSDGREAGCYDAEKAGSFRAGAYSSYNEWREELAGLVGKTAAQVWAADGADQWQENPEAPLPPTGGPFQELISFSDCEGTIGPDTCAKLMVDFVEWEKPAKAKGGWFYALYAKFAQAFKTAAGQGCVDFH